MKASFLFVVLLAAGCGGAGVSTSTPPSSVLIDTSLRSRPTPTPTPALAHHTILETDAADPITLIRFMTAPDYAWPSGKICCYPFSGTMFALEPSETIFLLQGGNAFSEVAPPYPPTSTSGPSGSLQSTTDASWATFAANGTLFVADYIGNAVRIYAPPYLQAPITNVTRAVDQPIWVGVDAAADLFVENAGTSAVTEYARPYTGPPIATISIGNLHGSTRASAAVDSVGNLFVIDPTVPAVRVYSPPYRSTPNATVTKGVTSPQALAADSDDSLYVLNVVKGTPAPNNYHYPVTSTMVKYSPPFTGAPKMSVTWNGWDNGDNFPGPFLVSP